jgi:hypothetical protein
VGLSCNRREWTTAEALTELAAPFSLHFPFFPGVQAQSRTRCKPLRPSERRKQQAFIFFTDHFVTLTRALFET